MEPIVVFALFLIMLGIVVFMSIRDQRNKERIATEIRQVGGEPIKISFRFVGYDRDNQHYDVQFADELGRKHETRCKVNIWQSNLYWQRTPAELLSDLPMEDGRWNRLSAGPASAKASSKEQLIDDLMAENERLREQLTHAESSNADTNRAKESASVY